MDSSLSLTTPMDNQQSDSATTTKGTTLTMTTSTAATTTSSEKEVQAVSSPSAAPEMSIASPEDVADQIKKVREFHTGVLGKIRSPTPTHISQEVLAFRLEVPCTCVYWLLAGLCPCYSNFESVATRVDRK
eukprot:c15681_g1_i1.p1 GENE.c15681_g1_i1~~c15681_g1_i1.p1  ORF type:complete len:131 (-),score=23.72 c15681_g1_i1:16-408(-)